MHACIQAEGKGGRWPPGITYQLLAVRAQSRGSVKLEAADVTQRPAIDLAYLSDPSGARHSHTRAQPMQGMSTCENFGKV